MKKQEQQWAVTGDLVFLLDDKGSAVPAKIKDITDRDYIFEPIIDDIKIPFKKFPKAKVGYNGGKVFRFKENAVAYQKAGNNIQKIIQEKIRAKLTSSETVTTYTEDEVNALIQKGIHRTTQAMVIAMRTECKIGSTRAKKVLNRATELVNSMSDEQLEEEAYGTKSRKKKQEKGA